VTTAARTTADALRRDVGVDTVTPVPAAYLLDATEARGWVGTADAVARPRSAEEAASVVAWCYEHDVAIVPRGGGTGFAGGAVPSGGVVLSLELLRTIRSFDPLLWRGEVEAGVTTADVRRLARENGLVFPPDPGAAEQSQIGGNVATNAGGPHAFKYGVTGHWVTGLEAVLPPGELVRIGGPFRKDVSGYDLKNLLVGSEGTLGVVTAAWLRFIPAPEASSLVIALYPSVAVGCEAIERIVGSGISAAAIEYLDEATVAAAGATFPGQPVSGFMVIAEADGSVEEVARLRSDLVDALAEDALAVHAPETTAEVVAIWRWREGVSLAVQAVRGGKVSEDIVVPLDRLGEAIAATLEIGARHGVHACSWGHAGDGNLHSTFLVDRTNEVEVSRAVAAGEELFALAAELGGSVSGEHGIGIAKNGAPALTWSPRAASLHEGVKALFDPKGLLNPGKKLVRAH